MPTQGIPLLNFNYLGILKAAYLLAIVIYGVFSLVLVKQVRIMTDTLEIELEGLIKIISYANFIAAVLVFLFAFTTL